ncbi:serine/threonine-protein phosphatase 6 regulatory ankyrin repeat subunit B-like [Schistocerca americana]|uniref:serine/threonine-protein phosphatase 6 regulatory ankyrin repeat subunit B-like n=1 Tax=Schistocerca americana TaxID=7009 RepID=UPI001F4F4BCD|nr:serine/threonine-protein phosphatase 6 regulatory ankyrin repeat subunit B-like [Schistocerca americana]
MAGANGEKGSLADNLGALLESGVGADVTLVVGESELPAHRTVLAARSPVFAAMLGRDTREAQTGRVEVADVREAVLRQLLHFVYTDTAPQLDSMAAELLPASDKYDLPLLKRRCEQAVARSLTVDNAAAAVVLAGLHSCPLLKSAAVEFVASHPQVMATEGWKNALLHDVEIAAEMCSLVAAASSKLRSASKDDDEMLAEELIEAAEDGDEQEVRKLIAAGAPLNAKDDSGDSALHCAVLEGHVEVVRCLVYEGANVNIRNSIRQTPLHYASFRGHVEVIWVLLGASAHIDAQDHKEQTPLHVAVASGNLRAVKALLAAGASKFKKDLNNKDPKKLASSSMRDIFDVL